MINVLTKEECCGCSACIQKCPKQCITLKEDNEGFLYPIVDVENCINCNLCENVCPVIHQNNERKPLKVYAAKNKNEEIRQQSSSGGFFTFLAEEIIKDGGVVFGTKFDDDWEVKHDYTETIEGLDLFRGSKYLQSRIERNYQKAETFLKQGRKVLFTGTPCQIAGLKRYLGKEYDNLLTLDFVCHGTPSPGVWRKYLKETIIRICEKYSVSSDPISISNTLIDDISFRNKFHGWKKYSFLMKTSTTTMSGIHKTFLLSEVFHENTFMKGFLANLYLRPSCYACPAKCGKSGSDITMGDLWGAPSIIGHEDDDKGISLVMINNNLSIRKENSFLWLKQIDYSSAIVYNPCIERSVCEPQKRNLFYKAYQRGRNLGEIINKLTHVSLYDQFISFIKHVVKRIIRYK